LESDVDGINFKAVHIQAFISSRVNKLLTEAAERSGRTKRQEARLRLGDHLEKFQSISEMHSTVDRVKD